MAGSFRDVAPARALAPPRPDDRAVPCVPSRGLGPVRLRGARAGEVLVNRERRAARRGR
jgi:hypothetical protein